MPFDPASVPKTTWDDAIKVEQVSSHTYSANLARDWCIGTVPNGGYVTAIFMAAARRHFSTTHAKSTPTPQIHPAIVHVCFMIRTQSGPCTLTITDGKIGRQYSVINVALVQEGMTCVVGYLTVCDHATEQGYTMITEGAPPPPPMLGRDNVRRLLTEKVDEKGEKISGGVDGWKEYYVPNQGFRLAATKVRVFTLENTQGRGGEQWITTSDGKPMRTESLGFIADIFVNIFKYTNPDGEKRPSNSMEHKAGQFWYPTLSLTMDVKKPLPESGVEWLFSRVNAKKIENGRIDMEVLVFDESGDLILICNHVGLMIDASRNLKKREKRGGQVEGKL